MDSRLRSLTYYCSHIPRHSASLLMKATNFPLPGKVMPSLSCTAPGTELCTPATRSSVFRSKMGSRLASTRILSSASPPVMKMFGGVRSTLHLRRMALCYSAMTVTESSYRVTYKNH